MKWLNSGGLYDFEIVENGSTFDLNVKHLLGNDYFWFISLDAAKRYVKREYEGLNLGRWRKVDDTKEDGGNER